jgi:hypothetical protein
LCYYGETLSGERAYATLCSSVLKTEQGNNRVQEVQYILEDPVIIPFDWLSIAFRLSYDVDEGWETQEVQAVLMSLITQVGFGFVT